MEEVVGDTVAARAAGAMVRIFACPAHALVGAHARARRPQQQHQRDNARASGTRAGSVGSGLSYVGQSDVGHSPDHTHTHTHTPTSLYV